MLLIDDVVDSGWTLAIISALLLRAGSGPVFLVSPFYPEAGFSAGNAMARNKYI